MLYVDPVLQTQPLLHTALVSSIHQRERVMSREGYHSPSLGLIPDTRDCHVGSLMAGWTLGLRGKGPRRCHKSNSQLGACHQWCTELVFQAVCMASPLLLWYQKSQQVLYGMQDQENSLCNASNEGTWESLIMIVKPLSKSHAQTKRDGRTGCENRAKSPKVSLD